MYLYLPKSKCAFSYSKSMFIPITEIDDHSDFNQWHLMRTPPVDVTWWNYTWTGTELGWNNEWSRFMYSTTFKELIDPSVLSDDHYVKGDELMGYLDHHWSDADEFSYTMDTDTHVIMCMTLDA
jgi:hypothetical protein